MERCQETIAPLAHSLDKKHAIDASFNEVDYGEWTNQPLAQLALTDTWKTVQNRPSLAAFPQGESLVQAQNRIVGRIEEIRVQETGNVFIASHCDMIKLAVAHYAGMHVDLFQRIVILPASFSVIRFEDFGCQIECVNDSGSITDFFPDTETASGTEMTTRAAKEMGIS